MKAIELRASTSSWVRRMITLDIGRKMNSATSTMAASVAKNSRRWIRSMSASRELDFAVIRSPSAV